jgi:FlaA1/EpsC-like NDP-sugar epimerase
MEMKANYSKFIIMIGTATVVMFGLMYLNSYEFSHVRFSETRTYMALYMGASMAVIMLLFMLGMYKNKKINLTIFLGSLVIFGGSLFLLRSQATVHDSSWMKAMIPHHSIAILTSERAQIDDVRIRELADGIIKAQRKEIKEMEWLIEDIKKNGKALNQTEAEARPVPDYEGKL